MCVDKHHYKCCGSCSMTAATLVLGALCLIGCIFDAIGGMWVGFVTQLIMALLFVMVIVKPHDVSIRKSLYYIMFVMTVINYVGLIAVFIYLLATDDWIVTTCYEQTSNRYDFANCLDYARTAMVIVFCVLFVIYGLCGCCTLQILYYGWKEQEHLYHERGQALQYNNQSQQPVQNSQPQPSEPGYQPVLQVAQVEQTQGYY